MKILRDQYQGKVPDDFDELLALPGVGPATAAGVLSFAFQKPAVYIETNVRTVFLHCLFPDQMGVSDKTLRPYVVDACPTYTDGEGFGPRAWYYALLDFGAFLKTQVANPSRRSAQYTRQSAFEGSNRQKRSFLVRLVLARPEGIELAQAARALSAFEQDHGRAPVQGSSVEALADQLAAEGFFHREGSLLIP